MDVQCMQALARILSLRELSPSLSSSIDRPDLLSQFSSQLQPLLPHLHTFHFDRK